MSPGYLAVPVKESCLRSIGDWFRGNGDDFELQSSTECPGVCASFYFQLKKSVIFLSISLSRLNECFLFLGVHSHVMSGTGNPERCYL